MYVQLLDARRILFWNAEVSWSKTVQSSVCLVGPSVLPQHFLEPLSHLFGNLPRPFRNCWIWCWLAVIAGAHPSQRDRGETLDTCDMRFLEAFGCGSRGMSCARRSDCMGDPGIQDATGFRRVNLPRPRQIQWKPCAVPTSCERRNNGKHTHDVCAILFLS